MRCVSISAWRCCRHVKQVEAHRIETITGKDDAWSYTVADDYTSPAHPLPNKRTTTVASACFAILFLLPTANSGLLTLQIHAGFRKGLSQGCVFEVAGAEILRGTEGRGGACPLALAHAADGVARGHVGVVV